MSNIYIHESINKYKESDFRVEFSIDQGNIIGMHFHDSIELIYCVKGDLEFVDNNTKINMHSHDIIAVNPMNIHSTKSLSGYTAIILHISMELLERFIPDIREYEFYINNKSDDNKTREMIGKISEQLQILFIANELKEEGYIFQCYSIVFELIYILLQTFAKKMDHVAYLKTKKNLKRIIKIMGYVSEHYQKEISLTEIANLVDLNPVYFSKFFRLQVGVTFIEYLNTVRLEHVYWDLMHTDLNVKDILVKHRFYNYKLFMRMFKNAYGGTPKEVQNRKKRI